MRFTSLLLLIILTISCASTGQPTKPMPVELKKSYTALEVLTRVKELQDTVIGLYDANPRGITKAHADLIVLFTVSSAEVIQSRPDGWQQTISASWDELSKEYVPTDPQLKVVWALTNTLMNSLFESK